MIYNTYDKIFTYEHLYDSYIKCCKNVRWKVSTHYYVRNDLIKLYNLWLMLRKRNYKSEGFHEFTISERGKIRHIKAVTFEERIVQKCLCDYYLVDTIEKYLIKECGATRKGKGITYQRKLFNKHLHKFYLSNNRNNNGYILLVDVHHYFESIDHTILLNRLKKIIKDKDTYDVLKVFITNFKEDEGLGLGSQISQCLALFYLSEMDHYIKEHLHIKYYGRYMDDFYLIHKDKVKLENCLIYIKQFMNANNLTLNPSKIKLIPLWKDFLFLKMRTHMCKNGKVIRKTTNKTFKRKKVTIDYINNFTQYKRYQKWLHTINYREYKNDELNKKLYYIHNKLNINKIFDIKES